MATMRKIAGHAATGVSGPVLAAALMIATPMVAGHEGMWLVAKPDRLAHGIPTVCFGETEGVHIGDRYTAKECDAMLAKKLVRYGNSAAACIHVPVSPKILASFIDLNYNIGEFAFCHSTVVARLNAGNYGGSCDAMRVWTNSAGQFRQGLLNRRLDEIAVCREGIKDVKRG